MAAAGSEAAEASRAALAAAAVAVHSDLNRQMGSSPARLSALVTVHAALGDSPAAGAVSCAEEDVAGAGDAEDAAEHPGVGEAVGADASGGRRRTAKRRTAGRSSS